ncbi:MAG TPA: type II toxin-antitoxin system RelE/ParE family toxin [Acetobacteraceae bacterium]|jgi:hypothetical protein|nr:type II toxin-antitoxin system RelE/ParE family toxin [Acetobacteraceae bacterium]
MSLWAGAARKRRLTDQALLAAVADIEVLLVDAGLGWKMLKRRIATGNLIDVVGDGKE